MLSNILRPFNFTHIPARTLASDTYECLHTNFINALSVFQVLLTYMLLQCVAKGQNYDLYSQNGGSVPFIHALSVFQVLRMQCHIMLFALLGCVHAADVHVAAMCCKGSELRSLLPKWRIGTLHTCTLCLPSAAHAMSYHAVALLGCVHCTHVHIHTHVELLQQ